MPSIPRYCHLELFWTPGAAILSTDLGISE